MASKKRFKRLRSNKLVKAIKNTSQPRVTATFVILGFLLGSIYAYHGIDAYYHTIRTFVAYQDNFKIHFPGKPLVTNLPAASAVSGTIESSRAYNYMVSSTGIDYLVQATKYAGINTANISKADLEVVLSSSLSKTASTANDSIDNTEKVTFKGLSATEATLIHEGTNTGANYLITFAKDHTIYTIQSSGLSLDQFNSFAGSFRFINN